MRKWFVAMCKHRQEFLADRELRKQGYETYLPKFFRHPTDDGWTKQPHGLRFPGYVFIGFDPEIDSHGPINHTRGVADDGLLMTGEKPQAVRKGYVSHLRGIENEDLERAISRGEPEPRTDLRDGDEVEIHSPGHRAHGNLGRYLETAHGMAWVLVGSARVAIPEADLKKTDKPKQSKKHNLRKAA